MSSESDRRSVQRFPLKLSLRYRFLGEWNGVAGGVGRTIDISSNGLFVASKRYLSVGVGTRLAAAMEWPMLLDSTTPIHLFMTGRVVRSDRRGFAISFTDYEFRTMKQGQRWLTKKLPGKSVNHPLSNPPPDRFGLSEDAPGPGRDQTKLSPESFYRPIRKEEGQ